MKVLAYSGVVALLLAACTQPATNLFDDSALPGGTTATGGSANSAAAGSSNGAAGSDATGGGTGVTEPGGGSATTGGTTMDLGGEGPSAGTASDGGSGGSGGSGPVAGTSSGGNSGGTDSSSAGAPDMSGAGQPSQPPEPVCGNGVIEAGEECDDAGHEGPDGCDQDCKVVCSQFAQGAVESDDHHCYRGFDQASFSGAEQDCSKRGAHLATISSEAENKLAQSQVNNSKWLGGLEDVEPTNPGSGDYGWITGEPFTYTNWGNDEPNQKQYHCPTGPAPACYEHCISMLGNGTWADHRCDEVDGYVCEWEPPGSAQ